MNRRLGQQTNKQTKIPCSGHGLVYYLIFVLIYLFIGGGGGVEMEFHAEPELNVLMCFLAM